MQSLDVFLYTLITIIGAISITYFLKDFLKLIINKIKNPKLKLFLGEIEKKLGDYETKLQSDLKKVVEDFTKSKDEKQLEQDIKNKLEEFKTHLEDLKGASHEANNQTK